MRPIVRILSVVSTLCLLAACGGGSGGTAACIVTSSCSSQCSAGGFSNDGGTNCFSDSGCTTACPHTQTDRMRVVNSCAYAIWVQHLNTTTSINEVSKVEAGQHVDYLIPDAGRASDRFWAKKGCDANGDNCTIGQSSDPCPSNAFGCSPPADSKLEATWGCTLSTSSQCAINPSAPSEHLSDSYINASLVDGYSFPFSIAVAGNTVTDAAAPCQAVDCSTLALAACPTGDNLSTNNAYPEYASENLTLWYQNDGATQVGCYSPCKKLNYTTTWGGIGLTPDTLPQLNSYCCPSPMTSAECSAGPVVTTEYVALIHAQCGGGAYAYAYDDAIGLHHCSASTTVTLTFGPNCP